MKELLNKRVVATNERGSKYAGILCGFKDNGTKFCLADLKIINRFGGVTASKTDVTRWFKVDKFKVELDDGA